jgi:hypothetical protein
MGTRGESLEESEVHSSGEMVVDDIVKVAESDGGAVGHSGEKSGEAALTLQRVFRGFLAREQVRKLLQQLMVEAQNYYEMGGQEQYYEMGGQEQYDGDGGERENDGMQQCESASSVEPERDVENDSVGLDSKAFDSVGGLGDVNAAVQGSKQEDHSAVQGEGIAQGDLEVVSQDADAAQGDESASSVEAERDLVVAEPGHAGDSEGISNEMGDAGGAGDRGVSGDLMGGDTSSNSSGSMKTSSPPGSPPGSPPTEASSRYQSDAGGGGGDDEDEDDDHGHHTPPLAPMESEDGGLDGDDDYDDDNDFIVDDDSDDDFDHAADEVMSSSTSRLTESRASASSRPMSAVRAGTGRPESASGSGRLQRRDEGSGKWQRGPNQSDDF